jgi:hypothetical protein
MKEKEIAELFRESELGVRVFRDVEPAGKWLDSQKPKAAIMCPYQGSYRLVTGEVCEFHKTQGDPECSTCRPGNNGDAANLNVGRHTPNRRG